MSIKQVEDADYTELRNTYSATVVPFAVMPLGVSTSLSESLSYLIITLIFSLRQCAAITTNYFKTRVISACNFIICTRN